MDRLIKEWRISDDLPGSVRFFTAFHELESYTTFRKLNPVNIKYTFNIVGYVYVIKYMLQLIKENCKHLFERR